MWAGACFRGSATPLPKGAGFSAQQVFAGSSLFICTLFLAELRRVTHVGEKHVSWGQPRLPSQESGVPGLPNFGGSPVFMPSPFNAERPNSAWQRI